MLTGVIIHVVSIGFTMGYTGLTCGQYGGAYYETPNSIEIYVCDIGDHHIDFYKNHEIGHYLYYKSLTDKQRKEYSDLYTRHKKIGIRAFFRQINYDTIVEDFADNYALKNSRNIFIKQRIKLIKKFGVF